MALFDFINGTFELFAGVFQATNVYRLYKDKQVRGTNIYVTAFFTSWGFWNLFYYPSLGQWLSYYGGLSIVLSNCAWIFLAVKYRKN